MAEGTETTTTSPVEEVETSSEPSEEPVPPLTAEELAAAAVSAAAATDAESQVAVETRLVLRVPQGKAIVGNRGVLGPGAIVEEGDVDAAAAGVLLSSGNLEEARIPVEG